MEIILSEANSALENTRLIQNALDCGGTVRVEGAGTYTVTGPLVLGNGTSLIFGAGVKIHRGPMSEEIPSHPFLMNKGVLTGERNQDILVEGLHLTTDGVDMTHESCYPSLRGHLSFLHVRNLVIRDFECLDLIVLGYGIHICDFDGILLEKIHAVGEKDGIHLSCGRRFTIRDSVFQSYDDGIALNAYDYALSTAIYGSITDGHIENCTDALHPRFGGSFCRMLPGIWGKWHKGMAVQNSTAVLNEGRLYTACLPLPPVLSDNPPISLIPPTHKEGIQEVGGIRWRMVKADAEDTYATLEHIRFYDIRLENGRRCVGTTLENNEWARSTPSDLPMVPPIRDISLDGIKSSPLQPCIFGGNAPVTGIHISNSEIQATVFDLGTVPGRGAEYPLAQITASGLHFVNPDAYLLKAPGDLKTALQFCLCAGANGEEPLCTPDVGVLSSDMPVRRMACASSW